MAAVRLWRWAPAGAIAMVAALATPALAIGPWTTPQTIDDRGVQRLGALDLAAAASGRATIVWIDAQPGRAPRRAVASAVRGGPAEAWSTPRLVGAIDVVPIGPIAAMNAAGRAGAVWSGPTGSLDAARLEAGARQWGPVARLVAATGGGPAAIALGPGGDALAGWQGSFAAPPEGQIQLAASPPGAGPWSAPQAVSVEVARSPRLAIGRDEALAIWSGRESAGLPIEVAVRSPDGSWSAPLPLSRPGVAAASPSVAVDAAGNAVAVWIEDAVMVAERPAGGAFGAPVAVSAPGIFPRQFGREQPPQIVLGTGGRAAIAWRRVVAPGRFAVEATSRARPGRWRAPRRISPGAGRSVSQIALAGDARGRLAIGWIQPRGAGVVSVRVGRAGDGRFGPVEPLSVAGREQPVAPRLAMDGRGRALAAWIGTIDRRRAIRVADRRPIPLNAPAG